MALSDSGIAKLRELNRVLHHDQLWNCPGKRHPLEFVCPRSWDALAETAEPAVRHCAACDRAVTLCDTVEEFVAAAEKGECVAVPRDIDATGLMRTRVVGRPSAESKSASKARLERLVGWWGTVAERVPGALGEDEAYVRSVVEDIKSRL